MTGLARKSHEPKRSWDFRAIEPLRNAGGDARATMIGVGRALAPPPSEPDKRYSRIRLSS